MQMAGQVAEELTPWYANENQKREEFFVRDKENFPFLVFYTVTRDVGQLNLPLSDVS
jgi:hypothetical protein